MFRLSLQQANLINCKKKKNANLFKYKMPRVNFLRMWYESLMSLMVTGG